MGLFDFVGDIFGGSSEVQQENKQDINIEVSPITNINFEEVAQAFERGFAQLAIANYAGDTAQIQANELIEDTRLLQDQTEEKQRIMEHIKDKKTLTIISLIAILIPFL